MVFCLQFPLKKNLSGLLFGGGGQYALNNEKELKSIKHFWAEINEESGCLAAKIYSFDIIVRIDETLK